METIARIEDKLDKITDSVAAIDKTLAVQAAQLAEHMRRTQLLEDAVTPLQAQIARWRAVLAAAIGAPAAFEALKWFLNKG